MAHAPSYPLTRERNLILAVLLILAAIAWGVLLWQAADIDDDASMGMAGSGDMPMSEPMMEAPPMTVGAEDTAMSSDSAHDHSRLTMGMEAPLFLAIWVAMMVAIMFPTAAPMILTFARVQANRQERGQVFVPTWLFVTSYIALWSATGVLAYGVAVAGEEIAEGSAWIMDNAARIGGAAIVIAGLYQLSPLKHFCLSKCRTPMSFILSSWRDGRAGALRMGLEHAGFCLGCCWLLFVILFPLGMMNIAVLALITLLIFAEKTLPIGTSVARVAAVAMIAYGITVIFVPDALPTMTI